MRLGPRLGTSISLPDPITAPPGVSSQRISSALVLMRASRSAARMGKR